MSSAATDRKQRLYGNTVRVLLTLIDQPMTSRELVEACHICKPSILNALRFWRDHQLVHIGSWQRSTGAKVPVYHAGKGKDARPPATLTQAQKRARWVARGGDPDRSKKLRKLAGRIERHASLAGQIAMRTQP